MPRSRHQHQLLLQDRLQRDRGGHGDGIGGVVGVGQRQVHLTGRHRRDPGRRVVVGDRQPHVRMRPAERAQRRRQQMDARGREGAEPQHPAREAGQPRQLVPRLLHLVQHPPGPCHQHLARLGQPGPAMVAYQQRRARLPLQLGQLLGQGGRGVAEPVGGPGDGARLRYGDQRGEPGRVVHGASLKHCLMLTQMIRNTC